jgi:hypothetical protein
LASNPILRTEKAFSEVKDLDVELVKKNNVEASRKLRRIFDWSRIGLGRD